MNFTYGIMVVIVGCSTIVSLATMNVFFDYPNYLVTIAFIVMAIMFVLFVLSIFFYESLDNCLEKWKKFNKNISRNE